MKVETHNGEPERSILIALIVSTPVLTKIAPKLSKSLFRSEWSDLIASWCAEYYKKYGTAPGNAIEPLYVKWCETAQDEDVKKTINRLISSLSSQYETLAEGIDPKFMIDRATDYFNQVAVEKHIDSLKADMERGHFEKAVVEAETFRRLSFVPSPSIDVLRDTEAQRRALEHKQKVLIKYKGDLGTFWNAELSEGSLVCIVAPMKQGKSFYLLDIAWQAMRQGQKVAYFQIGDLNEHQIMQRFQARAAYRPLERGSINFPMSITPSQYGLAQIDYETKVYDNNLTVEQGQRAFAKMVGKEEKLRLHWRPTLSISVNGVKAVLEEWDREGWTPKIVILDYAENLAQNNAKSNVLDATEETWAILSTIREERECLVVTAIQTNSAGFSTWVLTRKNFSKNKMIFSHCTAAIGLNRTDEEASKQIARLNFIVSRGQAFSETKCCYLAECRSICHVSVVSSF